MSKYQLLRSLTDEEYESLKQSIETQGVMVPVVYDEDGNILDGHHRVQVCEELGIKNWPSIIQSGLSKAEKKALVLVLNDARRHLSESDRQKIREIRIEIERSMRDEGYSYRRIAGVVGVSEAQVHKDLATNGGVNRLTPPETVIGADGKKYPAKKKKPAKRERRTTVFTGTNRERERAVEDLQVVKDEAPKKYVDPKRLSRLRRDRESQQRDEQEPRDLPPLPPEIDIQNCDFRDLQIPADSADLVFTDPPYAKEYLPLWSDLGEFAARVLKPGRLLVAYTGQYHLPEVLSRLGEHLDYWWLYAVTHQGAFTQIRSRRTNCGWKPLVVFKKRGEGAPHGWPSDLVREEKREKDRHKWQQSEAEAAYWIEALCPEGGLVVDPLMGSGTAAVAAVKHDRSFIGIEIDEDDYEEAKARISEVIQEEGGPEGRRVPPASKEVYQHIRAELDSTPSRRLFKKLIPTRKATG